MRWRHALLIVVVLQGLITPGGGIGTGDISKDDFPQVIAYRFSDVPSVIK